MPLTEGQYFLQVAPTQEIIGGRRRFQVKEPSEVSIEPRTQSDRSSGRLMGVGGIGLAMVGLVVMIAGGIPVDGEQRDDTQSTAFALGFFAFVAGGVLTPIGWVKAGRSAPALTVTPLAPR